MMRRTTASKDGVVVEVFRDGKWIPVEEAPDTQPEAQEGGGELVPPVRATIEPTKKETPPSA
jgi:hypothetical protein